MKRQFFCGVFILFQLISLHSQAPHSASSQTDILQKLTSYHENGVNVSIHLDPLIETNYYKHILSNQKDPGAMGFQLRIFSGSGPRAKDDAEKVRSLFLSKFEDVGAYLVYDSPDYKVYVGDCRSKSEILRLFNQVKTVFPNAFWVYRKINVSYD